MHFDGLTDLVHGATQFVVVRMAHSRLPVCQDYWVGIRSTDTLAAIVALSMVRERYFYIETTNCQVKNSFADNC